MPLEALIKLKDNYLFLFDPEHPLIMYDPKNILSELYEKAREYFEKHPEVRNFWNEKMNLYRDNKKKGKPTGDYSEILDEAELKFSKGHKITRDWYLTEK